MNLEFPGFGEADTFALASTVSFVSPAAAARLETLRSEAPPPTPPSARPVFRLSPAQLAAIERNAARLAKFSPAADHTGAMF